MTEPFRLPESEPTTILIDEGDFAGAQVDISTDIPYGLFKTIDEWRDRGEDAPDAGVPEVLEPLLVPFLQFGLVAWNLADRHGPIPPTREGCGRVDPLLLVELITTWTGVIGRAAPPLGLNGAEPLLASQLRTSRRQRRSAPSSGTGRSSRRASSPAKPTTSQPSGS